MACSESSRSTQAINYRNIRVEVETRRSGAIGGTNGRKHILTGLKYTPISENNATMNKPHMIHRGGILSLICLIQTLVVLLGCLEAGGETENPLTHRLIISAQEGRLTVQIHRVPLREVLAELAETVPLKVTIKENAGEDLVSALFIDLPLEEGIERLLQGQEYALLYKRSATPFGPSESSRLAEIVVLPKGSRSASQAVTQTNEPPSFEEANPKAPKAEEQVRFDDLRGRALEAADPEDRIDALMELADEHNDRSLPILATAIRDDDSKVRATAITLLAEQEGEGVQDLLIQALKDPDPQNRDLAQTLLEDLEVSPE